MKTTLHYLPIFAVLIICTSLSACGQTGDLYLPLNAGITAEQDH